MSPFSSGDSKSKTINIIRIAALTLIAVIILVFGTRLSALTPESIANYIPENRWLAACILIVLYGLKSMTIVFPVAALILAAGFILPPVPAFLVNMAGMLVCITLPFFLGRLTGRDAVEKMAAKRKGFNKISVIMGENEFFVSYMLRVLNMLPMDLVGMLLGAMNFKFTSFLLGSFIGVLPGMIAMTIIGSEITNPASPAFIGAVIAVIIISAASLLIYRAVLRRKK